MRPFLFLSLGVLALGALLSSCSSAPPPSPSRQGWPPPINLEQATLEQFTVKGIQGHWALEFQGGWVSCLEEFLSAHEGRPQAQKHYLASIRSRFFDPEVAQNCAAYFCSPQAQRCSGLGHYSIFSESINYILRKQKSAQFLIRGKVPTYNLKGPSRACFEEGDINSCAFLSAYYLISSYNREKFFQSRLKECELLGVSSKNCNFDL